MMDMEKLERRLARADFSRDSAKKDRIKEELMRKLEERQGNPELKFPEKRRKARFRPAYAVAAALAVTLAFSAVTYGGDIYRIIKEFSVGEHAKYYVTEMSEDAVIPLPEELRGLLFDAEGNALENFPKGEGAMYLASGERAAVLSSNETKITEDGKGIMSKLIVVPETEAEAVSKRLNEEREATRMTFFDSVDEARPLLAFTFMMPAILPNGFAVDRVYMFNNENGQLPPKEENKYLSYELRNAQGKEIYVQLRLMDEETAFESSASEQMREVTVNGYPGVLDGGNLEVEIDGVMYMFMADSADVSEAELMAMAESLR